jgi:hypothetical protein
LSLLTKSIRLSATFLLLAVSKGLFLSLTTRQCLLRCPSLLHKRRHQHRTPFHPRIVGYSLNDPTGATYHIHDITIELSDLAPIANLHRGLLNIVIITSTSIINAKLTKIRTKARPHWRIDSVFASVGAGRSENESIKSARVVEGSPAGRCIDCEDIARSKELAKRVVKIEVWERIVTSELLEIEGRIRGRFIPCRCVYFWTFFCYTSLTST